MLSIEKLLLEFLRFCLQPESHSLWRFLDLFLQYSIHLEILAKRSNRCICLHRSDRQEFLAGLRSWTRNPIDWCNTETRLHCKWSIGILYIFWMPHMSPICYFHFFVGEISLLQNNKKTILKFCLIWIFSFVNSLFVCDIFYKYVWYFVWVRREIFLSNWYVFPILRDIYAIFKASVNSEV